MPKSLKFILSFITISGFLLLPNLVLSELNFSDISQQHQNYDAIKYVKENNIVSGYNDNTFKPDKTITRAEFLKIVIKTKFTIDSINACDSEVNFEDLNKSAWFYQYICLAIKNGFVSGYNDNTFKPDKTITFAEASKIIVNTFGYEVNKDVSPWYKNYILKLEEKNAIPISINSTNKNITRAEMVEIIYRIMNGITNKDTQNYDTLETNKNLSSYPLNIPFVDTEKVRETWLAWYNAERFKLNLNPFSYDDRLNMSAIKWSETMATKNKMDHKRVGQTAYYDYNKINQWFIDLGLKFKNINRTTNTENIGYGYYVCNNKDCTDDLIASIRSTFEFFMAEKGKSYAPHYNSIINQNFKIIGLGIVIDGDRYYLTTHYGTEIL